MKNIKNDALARLFRSAALAKPDTAVEVSLPLQARILAAWRAGPAAEAAARVNPADRPAKAD